MPLYTIRNKDTGHEEEVFMSISEKEDFLSNNPQFEQVFVKVSIGDSHRLGMKKPDDGFRDRLRDIKKTHYGSNINTW